MFCLNAKALSSLNNTVQAHTIGILRKLTQQQGDAALIKAIGSEAKSAGADGCIYIATYADGSVIWGSSDLTLKELFTANIHQPIYCGPSRVSLHAALLHNINMGKPSVVLYLTKSTESLLTKLLPIPLHPPLADLYARFLTSKY